MSKAILIVGAGQPDLATGSEDMGSEDMDSEDQELDFATVLSQVQPQLLTQSERLEVHDLSSQALTLGAPELNDALLLPLTFKLPADAPFIDRHCFLTCQDVPGMRQRVQQLGYATGRGNFWLPVVLTARGPLYAEVIGSNMGGGNQSAQGYHQPIHLVDHWRQPLYQLAQRLLQLIAAPPATYLLQFGWQHDQLCFDRLWPFPTRAALASIGVQSPDLFTCYWRCRAGLPILDLQIPGTLPYQLPQFSDS